MKPILFIHVPKTAGKTIYKSFNLNRIVKHATLNYLQIKENVDINEYWIIGSVRNPWQRAVSLYNWTLYFSRLHHLCWKRLLYESTLVAHHYRDVLNNNPLKQVNYFINKDGEVQYDEIIRLEHFVSDISKSPVLGLNPIEMKNMKTHNVSGTGNNYRDYYDEEDIEYVRGQSEWEIKEFGYEFE